VLFRSIKLLTILPHTPVIGIGVNFGYQVEPVPEQIRNAFGNPHAEDFVSHEIETLSKSFKWGCKHADQPINMEFDFKSDGLLVRFNFHSDVADTQKAVEAIENKVVMHRAFAEKILGEVYDLTLEDS